MMELVEKYKEMKKIISSVLINYEEILEAVFVSLLSEGHVLLEGPPGVAKTTLVKVLAQLLGLNFKRIQFTPDLLPSDIIGTVIFNPSTGSFDIRFGPIFTNLLLADEINRAPPKTQSALLEAMEERQVTIEGVSYKLEEPFMVIATQNPIEQEGSLLLDQKVFVNGEIKTGEELIKEGKIIFEKDGTKVYEINGCTFSLNEKGETVKVPCYLYVLPYEGKIIKIKTETGREIKVTANHPLLVNENGIIKWKKAEELKEGDYIVSIACLPDVEIYKYSEKIGRFIIDEDFGFWIAFILAEGTIHEKFVEVTQKVCKKALQRFIEVSRKYGFNPKVYNRDATYVKIYSKDLVKELKIFFGIDKNRINPSKFIFLPKTVLKEFLRTFVSLDGSISSNRITIVQKKKENIEVLFNMLLRFNIIGRIRERKNGYEIRIQGEELERFIKGIGVLEDLEEKIKGIKTGISHLRKVPVNRDCIKSVLNILGITKSFRGKDKKLLKEFGLAAIEE